MKSIIFISALILLSSGIAFSQSQDTAAVRQQEKQKAGLEKTDKFIDRDGDGISDRREQGLGFKRGKHKEERQRGKNQEVQGKKGTAGTLKPTGSGTGKPDKGAM